MAEDAAATEVPSEQRRAQERALRQALLDAQFDLAQAKSETLLVLLNGADGSGKGEVLNRLNEWLDPRTVATMAYDISDPEESRRPAGWRYWRDMPARGRIGIVIGSWYHVMLLRRATGAVDHAGFMSTLEQVNRVEAMLGAESVRVLKIWLDLDHQIAEKRFRLKAKIGAGPLRPLVVEWGAVDTRKERRRIIEAAEELRASPGAEEWPWAVVPALDRHARDLAVGELVLAALRAAPNSRSVRPKRPPTAPRRVSRGPSALAALDLGQALGKKAYARRLREAQDRIYALTRRKAFASRALICVFEGNDAAGKGGAIRRLRAALDPIQSEIHPIAAPSDVALAHPWLWRFWKRMPDRGDIAIFDRSWYGRVLVERVEGFAGRSEWRRAYQEIADFEHLLLGSGYIVHKFWLSIDPDEQLARFRARQNTPHKRFKITEDDWRNREKWPLYAAAVEDMVALTSTPIAPWTLVEANNKRYSRVKVLETLAERLEREL